MKKTVSYRSFELLYSLYASNKQFFTLPEAIEKLHTSRPDTVRKLISDMVKRGLILRLKGGLYNLIPYELDSEEYFPNWHLAAEALAGPHEYYIGFYSALDIHNLITQPSLTEYIVTKKQISPKYIKIKDIRFEFVTLDSKMFFGYQKSWIDDFNKIYYSDLEKTILDCIYIPNFGGGITEIIKAIHRCRHKLEQDKLVDYIERAKIQAAIKRLGFILQSMDEFKDLRDHISRSLTNSYTLLDPSLPKYGKHYSQWKIIDNVGIESALQSIWT